MSTRIGAYAIPSHALALFFARLAVMQQLVKTSAK